MKKLVINNQNTVYPRIVKICLYLTVFLVPIFFLPFTSEFLEINKTLLFYFFVLVAAIFWFLDLNLNKEKKPWFGPLRLPLLIFGLLFLIATLFSYHLDYSLLGLPSYYHHSLLSIILFLLFFFLIINNLKGIKAIKKVIGLFLISSLVAVIFSAFQLFKVYLLPWAGSKFPNFNLVSNSLTNFSIYLALVILLIFIFLMMASKKWLKIILSLYLVLSSAMLILINVKGGLQALIIGLAVLLFFLTVKAREVAPKWTVITALILALALIFSFFNLTKFHDFGLQKDITLDQNTSLQVTKGALGKNLLFGSGPATFSDDLVRFRPVSFNNSVYWNLSFIKAGSEWWQILSTTGLLGFLSYLAVFAFYLIYLLREFYQKRLAGEEGYLFILLIAGPAMVFFSGIFYAYSFFSQFILILLMGLGIGLARSPESKERKIKPRSPASAFSSLGLSLVIIFTIVIIYFSGRIFLADFYFQKAAASVNQQEDLVKVENNLKKAVDLFGRNANYNFSLAQNFVVRAQLLAQEASPDATQMQNFMTQAIMYAQQGVELGQKDPAAYEALAAIYENVSLITREDISQLVVEAYNKAIDLDKNNPLHYYNLGNYQIVQGQAVVSALASAAEKEKEDLETQAQAFFDQGLANFNQAMALKENYGQAEVARALTLELKGETGQAIAEMEKLAEKYYNDFTIFYELGRMYLNQDKLDEAKAAFEKVVALYPDHSNSLWQLSVIYEKQGQKDLAIAEMEKVLELNPDNEQVKQRLEELRK